MRYRNDYDAVIQLPKVASEAGVICTPVPSLCPTGRDAPPPPCERKYNVTTKVFSVTPSSVGWLWTAKNTMITVGYV